MISVTADVAVPRQRFPLYSTLTGGFTVSVAIFSGRHDPEWTIPSSDPNYGNIGQLLETAKKGGLAYKPKDMPPRLGFKGFLIREGSNQYLILGSDTKPLQEALLGTMPRDLLLKGNIQEIKKEIASGAGKVKVKVGEGNCAPSFSSQKWNLTPKARRCNNCYNYATSIRTNALSQPGQATRLSLPKMNGADIIDAAKQDGLVVANSPNDFNQAVNTPPNSGDKHLVALVVEPGW